MIDCEVAISNHKRSWSLFGQLYESISKIPREAQSDEQMLVLGKKKSRKMVKTQLCHCKS